MEQAQPQSAMRRKSVFMEVGLVDEDTVRRERSPTIASPTTILDPSPRRLRLTKSVHFRSKHDILGEEDEEVSGDSEWESGSDSEESNWTGAQLHSRSSVVDNPKMFRLGLLVLALILMLPALQISSIYPIGARASAIPAARIDTIAKREDTDVNVCKRWAHQCTYTSEKSEV